MVKTVKTLKSIYKTLIKLNKTPHYYSQSTLYVGVDATAFIKRH